MAFGGLNKYMDAAAELGRNPVSKHQIQPVYEDEQADAVLPKPSRETKFSVSGTNVDRGVFICPVQLTTCRIGNLTRLIHTIAVCVTIHNLEHNEIYDIIIGEEWYLFVLQQISRDFYGGCTQYWHVFVYQATC